MVVSDENLIQYIYNSNISMIGYDQIKDHNRSTILNRINSPCNIVGENVISSIHSIIREFNINKITSDSIENINNFLVIDITKTLQYIKSSSFIDRLNVFKDIIKYIEEVSTDESIKFILLTDIYKEIGDNNPKNISFVGDSSLIFKCDLVCVYNDLNNIRIIKKKYNNDK